MRRTIIFSLAIPLVGLLGCGKEEPPAEIRVELRELERTSGECGPDDDSPCGRFTVAWLEVTKGPDETLRARLNDELSRLARGTAFPDQPAEPLEEQAQAFLDGYEESRRDFPDAATSRHWIVERRMDELHRDQRWLSVRVSETSYTGGAHTNYWASLATFDLERGELASLDELLVDDARAALDRAGEAAFRRAREIAADRSLEEEGFWFEEGFHVGENWAVVADGLEFHFDPYEVGSYALGSSDFVIPWAELDGIVRGDVAPGDQVR